MQIRNPPVPARDTQVIIPGAANSADGVGTAITSRSHHALPARVIQVAITGTDRDGCQAANINRSRHALPARVTPAAIAGMVPVGSQAASTRPSRHVLPGIVAAIAGPVRHGSITASLRLRHQLRPLRPRPRRTMADHRVTGAAALRHRHSIIYTSRAAIQRVGRARAVNDIQYRNQTSIKSSRAATLSSIMLILRTMSPTRLTAHIHCRRNVRYYPTAWIVLRALLFQI